MRRTNVSHWHHSARIPLAVLVALVASLTAQAGTLTIVDLPATGTDAATGISTDKVYTHAFDFGSNAPVTINGVVFERGPTANLSAPFTGTSRFGYRYSLNDTRATVNIQTHAGNDPAGQADGSSAELLRDMMYHAASTTLGAGLRLTLSDLVPGTVYSTRLYYRNWGGATPNTLRKITVEADGGHHGVFSDTLDVQLDGGGAHYIEYVFAADDADVEMRFITTYNNYGFHLYGFTNEVLRKSGSALSPSPADKAVDVFRDTMLAWEAGATAATHDLYLGTSSADVEAASVANPMGVLAGSGLSETSFDPGRLELGQTYFWRVDEVNDAPDFAVFKGGVWSFTVEPVSYAIAGANIMATASSASTAGMGAENTVNGSGLNANDEHSTAGEQMWLSQTGEGPAWIQYEFNRTYRLDKMLVWNSNQPIETMIGFGAKAVKVETSTDGAAWTALGDFEFAQATGAATYQANTTVNFAGAAAKYVKLTISSNWGGMVKQYGLSEVRFFQVPTVARMPSPASGKTGLAPQVSLSWRPGREAGSHQVFLGTDAANLPLVATVNEAAYETDLTLGQTYYWKVVEVNEAETPGTWESDVWSFSTAKSIAVEDFEKYTDLMDAGKAIFQTWLDGWENAQNGSVVGYGQAPFAEKTIYFGGAQSMPMTYDNSTGATYSEAVRTFDAAQDWTKYGLKTLSLYFFGSPDNAGNGRLYVKIDNTKVLYGGDAGDLKIAAWMPWTIDLAATGANLQKVTKLAVGIEGAGATGKLLIDDIRLYPTAAATVPAVDPGTTGLIAHYKFDGDAKDSAGTHHATPGGSPGYAAGKIGQALNMTTDMQYVTTPYAADLAMNTFTVATWVNLSDTNANRGIIGTRFNGDNTFDLKVDAVRIHGDIGSGTAWLNTAVDVLTNRGGKLAVGAWYHITYVIDDASDTAKLYVNGALATTITFSGTPLFMKSGQELRIGSSYPTEHMHGMIDDLRIYNRALSEAEVAGLVGRPGPVYVAP